MSDDEDARRLRESLRQAEFLADTLDEVLDRLSFIAEEANRQAKTKIRQLIGDVQEKLNRGPGDWVVPFSSPEGQPE